jgi:hypothetical protein
VSGGEPVEAALGRRLTHGRPARLRLAVLGTAHCPDGIERGRVARRRVEGLHPDGDAIVGGRTAPGLRDNARAGTAITVARIDSYDFFMPGIAFPVAASITDPSSRLTR